MLKFKQISNNVKVNSLCYQKNILVPIFVELKKKEERKGINRQRYVYRQSLRHTSNGTAAYLAKNKTNLKQ